MEATIMEEDEGDGVIEGYRPNIDMKLMSLKQKNKQILILLSWLLFLLILKSLWELWI